MSETDTETTLCQDCALPIEAPKPIQWGPFLAFQAVPRCKGCMLKVETARFERSHCCECPYKLPPWRPRA